MMENPNLIKRPIVIKGSTGHLRLRQGAATAHSDLRIGTSGWNYPSGKGTWNGVFYPPSRGRAEGLRRAGVLRRALRHGRSELDLLRPAARRGDAAAWARAHAAGFEFSVKLYQKFTHPRMFDGARWQAALPYDEATSRRCSTRCVRPNAGRPRRVPARHRAARASRQARRAARAVSRQLQGQRRHRATTSRSCCARSPTIRSPSNCGTRAGATHRRHAGAAEHVRRGVGPDRRAEVPLLDPPELPAQRRGLLLHAAARPQRRAVVAARQVGGSLQLPVFSRRAARSSPKRRSAAKALVKKLYLYTNNHFSAKSVANAAMIKQQLGEPIEGEYPPEFLARYPELAGDAKAAVPSLLHIHPDDYDRPARAAPARPSPAMTWPKTAYLPLRSGAIRQRHVDLAVGPGRVARMRQRHGALRVRAASADLGHADRLCRSTPSRPAAPVRLALRIARLRIAPLHHEARQRAMDALAVVEAALHERRRCARPSSAHRPDRSRTRTCPSTSRRR